VRVVVFQKFSTGQPQHRITEEFQAFMVFG
jgi:hypothetical protein